jgi:hypothetical protein
MAKLGLPLKIQSAIRIFGLPLYDIAIGAEVAKGGKSGHALGLFACGDVATGLIAVGTRARGIIAIGLFAYGVVAIGPLAIGGVTFCAVGLAVVAVGGVIAGLVAIGGVAIGVVAVTFSAMGISGAGDLAIGYYAAAERGAVGIHLLTTTREDQNAVQFFNHWWPSLVAQIHRNAVAPPPINK